MNESHDKTGQPQTVVPRRRVPVRGGPSRLSNAFALVLLVALVVFLHARFKHPPSPDDEGQAASAPGALQAERPIDLGGACHGRTQCSQMTSCTEAKYFLQNCPSVQMDSDRNGVPCEKTWCNSPLAK